MNMRVRRLAAVAVAAAINCRRAERERVFELRHRSSPLPTSPHQGCSWTPHCPVLSHMALSLFRTRLENFRILPVLGAGAVNVSPRIGHLQVTVDDLPCHWGDFSDSNTIVVVGLPPGQHKVLIELANPEHHIFTGQTVTFTVLGPA